MARAPWSGKEYSWWTRLSWENALLATAATWYYWSRAGRISSDSHLGRFKLQFASLPQVYCCLQAMIKDPATFSEADEKQEVGLGIICLLWHHSPKLCNNFNRKLHVRIYSATRGTKIELQWGSATPFWERAALFPIFRRICRTRLLRHTCETWAVWVVPPLSAYLLFYSFCYCRIHCFKWFCLTENFVNCLLDMVSEINVLLYLKHLPPNLQSLLPVTTTF